MPRPVLALALACAAVSVLPDADAGVNSVMALANAELTEALARAPDGGDETLAWAALAVLPGQDAARGCCRRIAARPAQCGPA
ncbi:hypothetical protein [Nannocystis radixulma]|uniref:Uncharacterized protein n=1 Tax=Nannocystis radixulma TaxID=2995305 RepID=A0ABT5AZV7_9BACT|nr:hypothetical protein [Nannocystis radixulma]MDC0666824.1 hypothetical protein [Nannocystis radixulma]